MSSCWTLNRRQWIIFKVSHSNIGITQKIPWKYSLSFCVYWLKLGPNSLWDKGWSESTDNKIKRKSVSRGQSRRCRKVITNHVARWANVLRENDANVFSLPTLPHLNILMTEPPFKCLHANESQVPTTSKTVGEPRGHRSGTEVRVDLLSLLSWPQPRKDTGARLEILVRFESPSTMQGP